MFIYIARHAWAGERGDPRWPDDSLRELTAEGIERFTEVAKSLGERGFEPERIATSPYTRCRQTADIIAKHVVGRPTIEELEALEPGSDLEPLIDWSNEQGANVCWVGHSPDVERLAAELIGDGTSRIRFAKGAIAAIAFEGERANTGGGELYWLATAKLLGV
jgi:phosphohistidine phosphatase